MSVTGPRPVRQGSIGLTALLRLQPFDEGEDPDRAPAAYLGDDAVRPFTFWRAVQNRLWMYLLGLVFLGFAVPSTFAGELTAAQFGYRLGCLVLLCLLYAGSAVVSDATLAVRWVYVVVFLGLIAATAGYQGGNVFTLGIYATVMVACLIPWRQARWVIAGWALVSVTVSLIQLNWVALSISILGVFFGLATGGGAETGRLAYRLRRSENRNAVLAVAAERERIARDLHDILGHSLTAIAIKTDLAHRLVDRDPAGAKLQLSEVEQVARQALADVRATASGIREVRVATEIASARSVLLAAGLQANVGTAVAPMSDAASETLGFVVREAITNAIRHAGANTATISTGAHWVQVADDGRGIEAGPGGSGLDGLRARVEAAGGTLTVTSGPHGTTVRGEVPESPVVPTWVSTDSYRRNTEPVVPVVPA